MLFIRWGMQQGNDPCVKCSTRGPTFTQKQLESNSKSFKERVRSFWALHELAILDQF